MTSEDNINKKSVLPIQAAVFLNLRRLPARLNKDQIAWLLNIPSDKVGPLAKAGIIELLGGKPDRNIEIWGATVIILSYRRDIKVLTKITKFLRANEEKKTGSSEEQSFAE